MSVWSRGRASPTAAMTPARKARKTKHSLPRMSPSPSILRKHRSVTPSGGGDRFISSRRGMNVGLCRRALLFDSASMERTPTQTPIEKEYKRRMLSSLCNVPLESLNENAEPKGLLSFVAQENRPRDSSVENPFSQDILRVLQGFEDKNHQATSRTTDKIQRTIPSQAFKVLHAPNLVNDFYLDLISWSKDNVLAFALGSDVYLYNATTCKAEHQDTDVM